MPAPIAGLGFILKNAFKKVSSSVLAKKVSVDGTKVYLGSKNIANLASSSKAESFKKGFLTSLKGGNLTPKLVRGRSQTVVMPSKYKTGGSSVSMPHKYTSKGSSISMADHRVGLSGKTKEGFHNVWSSGKTKEGYHSVSVPGKMNSVVDSSELEGFKFGERLRNKISDEATKGFLSQVRGSGSNNYPSSSFKVYKGRGTRLPGKFNTPRFQKSPNYSKMSNVSGPKYSKFSNVKFGNYSGTKYSMASQKPKFSNYKYKGAKYSSPKWGSTKFSSSSRNYGYKVTYKGGRR